MLGVEGPPTWSESVFWPAKKRMQSCSIHAYSEVDQRESDQAVKSEGLVGLKDWTPCNFGHFVDGAGVHSLSLDQWRRCAILRLRDTDEVEMIFKPCSQVVSGIVCPSSPPICV